MAKVKKLSEKTVKKTKNNTAKQTKQEDKPKLMARPVSKGAGGPQRKLPTKQEVRQTNNRLAQVIKVTEEIDKVKKSANTVYSNDREVVTSSVFKKTASVPPGGKAIEIDDITKFPM